MLFNTKYTKISTIRTVIMVNVLKHLVKGGEISGQDDDNYNYVMFW